MTSSTTEEKDMQLPSVTSGRFEITTTPVGGGVQIRDMDDCLKMANLICEAGVIAKKEDKAKVAYMMLAGIEMGLTPLAALNGLYVGPGGSIGQKASLIKDQMVKKGYTFKTIVFSDEKCEVEFFKGKESLGRIDWTWKRAIDAGLTTGRNSETYKKYPRNMLLKQCLQDGARVYMPGLFNGFETYGEEELDSLGDDTPGPVKAGSVAPPGSETVDVTPVSEEVKEEAPKGKTQTASKPAAKSGKAQPQNATSAEPSGKTTETQAETLSGVQPALENSKPESEPSPESSSGTPSLQVVEDFHEDEY